MTPGNHRPTFAHLVPAHSHEEYRFFCARQFLKTSNRLLASNALFRSMLLEARDGRRLTMTAQQQQALDSFYALDNVITIKITMPQAEWDKVRTEEPKGGRCEWDWTGGSRFTWRKADKVEISGTRFPRADDVHRRRDQEEVVLRLDRRQEALPPHRLRQVQQHQRGRDRSTDRIALCDPQQLQTGQVLYQADARLPHAADGRFAQFAVQLRPRVRERNSDRPRARRRNLPGRFSSTPSRS